MTAKTRLESVIAVALLGTPLLTQAQTGGANTVDIGAPNTALIGLIVGIGAVFVLGIIAIAVIGPQWMLRGTMRDRAELIDKLLAAGQPVPPELLKPPSPPGPPPVSVQAEPGANRVRSLRRGVGLLAFGIGIAAVAYFGFDSPRTASWGLLFLALSIASFINAIFFSGVRAKD